MSRERAGSLSGEASAPSRLITEREAPEATGILTEIWIGFRPYLVHFSVDFLVSGSLWMMLFLFKVLTKFLEVSAAVSEFIETIHSVGVVLVFALFGILFMIDIYALHRDREERAQ